MRGSAAACPWLLGICWQDSAFLCLKSCCPALCPIFIGILPVCLSKVSFPQGRESHWDPEFVHLTCPQHFCLNAHCIMLVFIVVIKMLENKLINLPRVSEVSVKCGRQGVARHGWGAWRNGSSQQRERSCSRTLSSFLSACPQGSCTPAEDTSRQQVGKDMNDWLKAWVWWWGKT